MKKKIVTKISLPGTCSQVNTLKRWQHFKKSKLVFNLFIYEN